MHYSLLTELSLDLSGMTPPKIIWWGGVGLAVLSSILVRFLIDRFRAAGVLDEVGHRSSHVEATPRGGGLGFVAATSLGWLAVALATTGETRQALVGVLVAGLGVALVGLIDDLRGVPAAFRLLVHLAAAMLGLWALGVDGSQWPGNFERIVALGATILAVAWSVNAFNFMDGTDGFAATHGFAACVLVLSLLAAQGSALGTLGLLALGAGAGLLGFLPFNWPRARIFMGDVGSGWIGLTVGLLVSEAWMTQPQVALSVGCLLSPFVMDASVCLVRRALRGECVWKAHRSHAFQNLARRLGSHARLLGVWWTLSLVIHLPLSLLAWFTGSWHWLTISLALGAIQAIVLQSGVHGIAETAPPG
jgi:Fuc2NAc and GlcNAc transferase